MTEASNNKVNLPIIPNKRYFSISEAATLCAVKPHVLRYWEQEFSQLKPNKRRGNRRYYQHSDLILARKIRHLLYEKGYTIEGARQVMQGKKTEIIREESNKNQLKLAILELEQLFQQLRRYERV